MTKEEIKKEVREKSYHTSTDYCEKIDLKDLFEILDKYKEKECDYKKYKIERGFDVNRRINIPKKILDELDIKEYDTMILYVEDNKIILEKKE
jgi:AbrB family looped-hinge helix DNA binding protein